MSDYIDIKITNLFPALRVESNPDADTVVHMITIWKGDKGDAGSSSWSDITDKPNDIVYQTSLDAETARATAAEDALSDDISARALQSALDAETARATAAENALSDDISTRALQTALDAETARAIATESELYGDLDSRALQGSLDAETARAMTAESALSDDISARALQSSLFAEIVRATAAEDALSDAIVNIDGTSGELEVSRIVAITSSNSNYAVPAAEAGEVAFFLEGVGGGASGMGSQTSGYLAGGGGRPGLVDWTPVYPISALPAHLAVVIGAGGAQATANSTAGNGGSDTTIGIPGGATLLRARGGTASTQIPQANITWQYYEWIFNVGRYTQPATGYRQSGAYAVAGPVPAAFGPGAGAQASYATLTYVAGLTGGASQGRRYRIGGAFVDTYLAGGVGSTYAAGGTGQNAAAESLAYGSGGASGSNDAPLGRDGGAGGFPGGGGGAGGCQTTGGKGGAGGNGVARIIYLKRTS